MFINLGACHCHIVPHPGSKSTAPFNWERVSGSSHRRGLKQRVCFFLSPSFPCQVYKEVPNPSQPMFADIMIVVAVVYVKTMLPVIPSKNGAAGFSRRWKCAFWKLPSTQRSECTPESGGWVWMNRDETEMESCELPGLGECITPLP